MGKNNSDNNLLLNTLTYNKKYSSYFFVKLHKHMRWCSRSAAGRNFLGRICVFHQGGGTKKIYNYVDNCRRLNLYGYVLKIFKQRGKTAYIGSLWHINGLIANITLAEQVYVGSSIFGGQYLPADYVQKECQGWAIPIKNINLFTVLSNIEPWPYHGSNISTAAGVGAVLSKYDIVKGKYTIKLSSGWQISIVGECLAVVGKNSNIYHRYTKLFKAGTARKLGIRPTVRGIIKNPCDHPHGGGEGKNSPPRAQVSPWGKLTKGTPTNNKKYHRRLRREFKSVNS